jgi:hypothetical protein
MSLVMAILVKSADRTLLNPTYSFADVNGTEKKKPLRGGCSNVCDKGNWTFLLIFP